MSHLHITDDLLHWGFAVLGIGLNIIIIGYILLSTKKEELFDNIAKLGIMSALMMIVMSIPLGFPFHINLSILTALILGPKLGYISVLLVNLILSTFGHGGITVVGLNTLIIGAEVFLGYHMFSFFLSKGLKWQYGLATAVLVALIISASLMIAVIGFGGVEPAAAFDDHGHSHEEVITDHSSELSYGRFATIVMGIVLLGAPLEALVILVVVNYFRKVRPDYLLKGGV